MQPTSPNSALVAKILWGALAASHVLIVFVSQTVIERTLVDEVARFVGDRRLIELPDFSQSIPLMLTMVAVGCLVMSTILPRLIAARSRQAAAADFAHQGGGGLIKRAMPLFIVSWALAESVTLFGFVLAMQAREPRLIFAFFIVAFLRHLRMFPSESTARGLYGV